MADVVFEAMMPWLKDNYCNAGSVYKKGREAKAAIEKARGQVAKMFNSDPENIVFTSGGSEGNSFVFQAAAERLNENNRKSRTHDHQPVRNGSGQRHGQQQARRQYE